jgi:hypothetical protein
MPRCEDSGRKRRVSVQTVILRSNYLVQITQTRSLGHVDLQCRLPALSCGITYKNESLRGLCERLLSWFQ